MGALFNIINHTLHLDSPGVPMVAHSLSLLAGVAANDVVRYPQKARQDTPRLNTSIALYESRPILKPCRLEGNLLNRAVCKPLQLSVNSSTYYQLHKRALQNPSCE